MGTGLIKVGLRVSECLAVNTSRVISPCRTALWYFSGNLEAFGESLIQLPDALKASGLTPQSEALIFDRASYLLAKKSDEIACKIMVPLTSTDIVP